MDSNSSESSKEKKSINIISIIKSKDYYTGEYYLKIVLNSNNELIIINYNTKKLDGIKFSLRLNIGILHKASNLFKRFEKIDNIYDLLIKLLKKRNINYIIIQAK